MEESGQTFGLPGTSGIIFSWVPPMGLDIKILQYLEHQLKSLLFEYLNNYADHSLEGAQSQSHQSLPATSFMDIDFSNLEISDERALDLVSDEEEEDL